MQFQSEQKNLNAAGLPGPAGNASSWLESSLPRSLDASSAGRGAIGQQ